MLETATSYDHYRVLRREDGSLWELGRGVTAVTFKAEDINLGIPVALKMLKPVRTGDASDWRERFVRGARAAARLRHRNVASIFHFGRDGERCFYAMEFVDGETLEALVQRSGPLASVSALQIALQVSKAFAAAAREGVVHRDIKPANVMITFRHEDDGGPVVKVVDFGLAGASGVESSAGESTGFTGTAQYASPEQIQERPADIRSDIYSLGCTLWFMLTGRPPFRGSLASVFAQQIRNDPPWREIARLPAAVRSLLGRMLSKSPEHRPQTAALLTREIEQALRRVERHQALKLRGGRWLACGIPFVALLVWGSIQIYSSYPPTATRTASLSMPSISSSATEQPLEESTLDRHPPYSLWEAGLPTVNDRTTGDLSLRANPVSRPEATNSVPSPILAVAENHHARQHVIDEAASKRRKLHRFAESRDHIHSLGVFEQMHRKLDGLLARLL